jgi:hypothetical protein
MNSISGGGFGTILMLPGGFRNNSQATRRVSEQFSGYQAGLGTILRLSGGFRNNFQATRRVSEQFSGYQAGFGTIFRLPGGFRNNFTGTQGSVMSPDCRNGALWIGRIFVNSPVSIFTEASWDFIVLFLHKKAAQNLLTLVRMALWAPRCRIA